MSNAREAIFARLGRSAGAIPAPSDPARAWNAPELTPDERLDLLEARMKAVGTQVRRASAKKWAEELAQVIKEKAPASVAYGSGAWFADKLAAMLGKKGMPAALVDDAPAEDMRDKVFAVDASVTSARMAIAENGSLVLTPGRAEPRLLSLVPPVHIVLLKASDIVSTFAEAVTALEPDKGMPANMLLISGPSKTADIELTLAFGVHGPKELIVIILQ